MPRLARIVGVDYPHHIIQRGNNRQTVFFKDEDRSFYLELLKKYSQECSCRIKAYCLMKSHIHILAIPANETSLAKTMQKLSLRYTQYINKKYKRTGRLWECRFHSAVVEKETYLWAVCRYIERNPVRAKIIDHPNEYRWSSAKANTSEEIDGIIEPIWQDLVDRKEYITFLNKIANKDEIEKIRKYTYCGRPIGTERFLDSLQKDLGLTIKIQPRGRPRKIKK